jgi:sterol 3beta-glucosyltransferase
LEFANLGGNVGALAQSMQALLEGGQLLRILSSMRNTARQLALQATARGLEACQGCDLIFTGLGGLFVSSALSEKLRIPLIQAYLYPFTLTGEFPGVLTPLPRSPLTRWANKPSHRLSQQLIWQTTRAAENEARAKVLQLPPAPFWGPFGPAGGGKAPVL